MISQTIAVAAAAALFAPAVYADADAPTAATPATPAGDPVRSASIFEKQFSSLVLACEMCSILLFFSL